MSRSLGHSPVAAPVTITASARMNSAAAAVSPMLTSAVSACEACFFFTSAHTRTRSAPMCRRKRSSDAADDSRIPASATCANANPSTAPRRAAWRARDVSARHGGAHPSSTCRRSALELYQDRLEGSVAYVLRVVLDSVQEQGLPCLPG